MKDYGMAKNHNPKSKEIYDFKSGGDGDNGEFLMDLLDCYFESKQRVIKEERTFNKTIFDVERPIKLIYEGDPKIESNGDYDVTITQRLTLSEIAELFGVDEVDILDGKIGILTLEDNEGL